MICIYLEGEAHFVDKDSVRAKMTEKENGMTDGLTTAMPSPVVRTSAGLRNALFDELDALRNGSTNPAKANAVAKLADQVVATVKMELDVSRHMARYGKEAPQQPAIPAVPLG